MSIQTTLNRILSEIQSRYDDGELTTEEYELEVDRAQAQAEDAYEGRDE